MQLTALTDPTETNSALNARNAPPANTEESESQTSVEFQNFLQLLTAQLRNQDPLSPLDSTQFVAQLASFSTVEQLVNANERLDSIASSIVNDSIDQYAGLIGKEAEVNLAEVNLLDQPIRFRINGTPEADRAEIVITDTNNIEQARFIGQNGDSVQVWDGSTPNGPAPAGRYRIFAEYFSGNDVTSVEEVTTFGVISEVRLTSDSVELRLENGTDIDLDNLIGLSGDDR